jgi:hypothetical protein
LLKLLEFCAQLPTATFGPQKYLEDLSHLDFDDEWQSLGKSERHGLAKFLNDPKHDLVCD